MAAQNQATEAKAEKVIKYVGTADVRRISKADWKSIGIEQESLEWSRSNNFQVLAEGVSADALEYLDSKDDGFKVVEKA